MFRADASTSIGTGHIMRCLTLANRLMELGAEVSFISKESPGHLCDYVESKGYLVHRLSDAGGHLPQNKNLPEWEKDSFQTIERLQLYKGLIDWLIVDHYALDMQWENKMRSYVKNIMVIDDLANREHDCDLLLDQNYYDNLEVRYTGLVPANCESLLGPKYVLLRPEFRIARRNLRKRDGQVRRILIFFGGSDATNETSKALKSMKHFANSDIKFDVVVGSSNPYKEQIQTQCKELLNAVYYCQVNHMAELMAQADLAIGAGGTATWERMYLGLPTLTVITASNQVETTMALAKLGTLWNLGWYNHVSEDLLSGMLQRAIDNPSELIQMGDKAMKLMDEGLLEPETHIARKIIGG